MVQSRVRKVLIAIEAPPDRRKFFNFLVPLGPLGVVSFLESRGIRTDFVDCQVEDAFPDVSEYDAVGFSVTNVNIGPTLERARRIKEERPDTRIFVGGPGAQLDPRYFCQESVIDAVVTREAESVISAYLLATDPGKVPGLWLKDAEGRCFHTGEQPWKWALDNLPFPALDRVDISRYDSPIRKARPLSSIVTSRGCPWKCTFCHHSEGVNWRPRSVQNVVDEIQWQVEKLGVREIAVFDYNFTTDQRRASRICREIRERHIDVHLQLAQGSRVDCMSRSLLEDMKAAGFWIIGVAPETGDPETMRRIGKNFEFRAVRDVVKWCKELDLCTWALFMLGFPWESEGHVNNTIRFAQELDADITQFTRLLYLPGTPLYEEYAAGSTKYRDTSFFDGSRQDDAVPVPGDFLQRSIIRAYRATNMRPRKILRLLRLLPLSSLYRATRFALATSNI